MSFWNSLNLKEVAQSQLNNHTIEYWFRKKYNLSPKDPRYLNCELWEMALDLELDNQAETLIRKKTESLQNMCPKCNSPLEGNVCPKCKTPVEIVRERYFDPDFAEYEKQVEEESVDISKLKWEDVKDTD